MLNFVDIALNFSLQGMGKRGFIGINLKTSKNSIVKSSTALNHIRATNSDYQNRKLHDQKITHAIIISPTACHVSCWNHIFSISLSNNFGGKKNWIIMSWKRALETGIVWPPIFSKKNSLMMPPAQSLHQMLWMHLFYNNHK